MKTILKVIEQDHAQTMKALSELLGSSMSHDPDADADEDLSGEAPESAALGDVADPSADLNPPPPPTQ